MTAGGETGRHIAAIVEPLLIHDLPVTVWWPGEPPLGSVQANDLLEVADRLVIDGSSWSGDGFDRLRELARLVESGHLAVFDFALVRQSRWREAIASTFDLPDFLPYLRSIRRIAVTYATHDELGRPGTTNMVKPLYHVAWIASRLDMAVSRPLAPLGTATGGGGVVAAGRPSRTSHLGQPAPGAGASRHVGGKPLAGRGYGATLHHGHTEVGVVMRPVLSGMPSGTTLRVELLADRRGSELRIDVTAEAETVAVHAWQDGVEVLDRRFMAPRRTETDLLAEAIESPQRDVVAEGAIRMAARIVPAARGRRRGMTGPTTGPTGRSAEAPAAGPDEALGPRGGRPVLPPLGSDPGPFLAALAAAGEPSVLVTRDPSDLAEASAARLAEWLVEAVERRGRADVALTGGSTPRAMYRRLVEPRLRDRVDWDRVHLWWGDDRFVPRADPPLERLPRRRRPARPGRHPDPGRERPSVPDRPGDRRWAPGRAGVRRPMPPRSYDRCRSSSGWPAFDVVLVGIGPDGHLLSVFPGSPALASDRVGLGIAAPEHVGPHVERVTLNPAILGVARRVLATAAGAGKAAVVARILEGARDPAALPGVLARRSTATWLLDAPAASRLGAGPDRVVVRRAAGTDAAAIANVWLAAFAATYDFPHAHTDDEVRRWIRDDLLRGTETWVAVDPDGRIAGFMSLTPDFLDQLYVRPGRTGRGIGSRLVDLAKTLRPGGLDLYTFQANDGGRRFYERHGFRAVAFDDEGAGNEEHQPDVRYRWRPTDPTAS